VGHFFPNEPYEAEDRRLEAENRRLIEDVLQKVGRVPSVRYLYLGRDGCVDDAMLAPLENLDELEELGLSDQDITGEGLIFLSSLEKLRWLDLGGSPLSDAGLYHLKQFKNLEYLNLGGTMITGRRLEYLRGLPRLHELDLSGLHLIDDRDDNYTAWTPPTEVLGQMTQLRVLGLSSTKLDNFDFLAKMSELEELDVSGTEINRREISQLGDLAKLKNLRLARTRVGAEQIASFSRLKSLEHLDVWGTYLDDTACENLCNLRSLKFLTLYQSRVSTIGVARLSSALPQLDLGGFVGRDPATNDEATVPVDDSDWTPVAPIF
jgi:Leucine-rich repeat (LRR) protein